MTFRVHHVNGETCETFSRDDAASRRPASDAEVMAKYAVLMRDVPADRSAHLLTRLQRLEAEDDADWLRV